MSQKTAVEDALQRLRKAAAIIDPVDRELAFQIRCQADTIEAEAAEFD